MSGTKRISALTELASTSVAGEDILAIVDMSQASVTDKTQHVTVDSLLGSANTDAKVSFKTVALLLADTTRIGYSGARFNVAAGDIITAGGFRYEVAASGASDNHVATAGGVKLYYRFAERLNVKALGAAGDDSTDDTDAIQSAIDILTSLSANDIGGKVYLPRGTYKTTAVLLMKAGVEMEGDNFHSPGAQTSATLVKAYHNGVSVISFKGAQGCALRDVGINVASTYEPKTLLLFGRASSSSAGLHHIQRVFAFGAASVSVVYSVASEQNSFEDCIFDLAVGSTGKVCLFIGQADDVYTVDSLTASSCAVAFFKNCDFKNRIDDAASYGIYIRTGGSTGAFTFVNCYQHQAGGAYVAINNGQTDGTPSFGGISFFNQCGEILDLGTSNSPTTGYYIFGNQPMRGLVVIGGRMAQLSGVSPKTFNCTVALEDCIIDVPQNKDGTSSTGSLITSTFSTLTRSVVNHVTLNNAKATTQTGDLTMVGALNFGTFSSTGASAGKTVASGSTILDSSTNSTSAANHQRFYNPNGLVGTIQTNASATAYNTSSDYRIKENVALIENALWRVMQLKPSSFNFIGSDERVEGFIAHEVAEVAPYAVTGEKDAVDADGNIIRQQLDNSKLMGLCIAALKELAARVKALES